MVSSCTLYLDEIELTGQKAFVPDVLRALFQESDRVESYSEEYERDEVRYVGSRDSILRRLDLMGCTLALAKARFEEWRVEEIRFQRSFVEDNIASGADETLKALEALSWEEWQRRIPEVLRTMFDDEFVDETDRRMKDLDDESWLWFDRYDSLLSLRAIIEAAPDFQIVNLDVSDLIHAGWIDKETRLCEDKVRIVPQRGQPGGPTIILAEGKSDIAVLKASIGRFHPDLADFVTFLDHSEFRVDGGAGYVVKFLKAFAAARVPANIVAVFDNDAAGLAAYGQARALNLPSNMTCIHLPDIDLGRSYPTIGPQGQHESDINGRACGIELYLGRTALSSNGTLRPVRWTGYDSSTDTYQGEIDEKGAVQDEFLAAMRMGQPCDPEIEYPEMVLVWETILHAATRIAELAQSNARLPPEW